MATYLVGPTRPYTTITAAFNAATDAMVGGQPDVHRVIVDAGFYFEFLTPFSNNESSTNYLTLEAATGSEHRGNINSGVIVFSSGFTPPLNTQSMSFFRAINIVFKNTNTSGFNSDSPCVSYGTNNWFENCLFVKDGDGYGYGVTTQVGNTVNPPTTTFINCLAINLGTPRTFRSNGFRDGGTGDNGAATGFQNLLLINCGSYNFYQSYYASTQVVTSSTFINCWGYNNGADASALDFAGRISASSSNNASRDTTAPGSNSLINRTLANLAFVNSGSNNFHILSSSVLFAAGLNQSSVFTQDWDLETIATWCIGPDCFGSTAPAPSTASSPWVNQNVPHEEVDDAETAKLVTKQGERSPSNVTSRDIDDAKAPRLRTKSGEPSPELDSRSNVPSASASVKQAPKGYKDGFISFIPETDGYTGRLGTVLLGTGNKLQFYSDTLGVNQEYVNVGGLGPTRGFKNQVSLGQDPGGDVVAVLKTNDNLPLFQSHFQKRIATNPGVGTTFYQFCSDRGNHQMSGSNFGTGSYNSIGTRSGVFTLSAFKAVEGSAFHFKNGLCDKLVLSFDARGEALVVPTMTFKTVELVASNGTLPVGSATSKSHFLGHQFSVDFLGLPVVKFEIESKNNIQKYRPVGGSTVNHRFGRYEVTGQAAVDVSKVGLAHFGSMLNSSPFSVVGTLFGDEQNKMVFDMPNVVIKPYELNINTDTVNVPFSCYESEDGGTAPLTIKLWTTGYDTFHFQHI